MYGLVFEDQAPVLPASPNRMDIACFAGFAAARETRVVTADIQAWWRNNAWDGPRPSGRVADVSNLLQVPVPIDSWEVFDHLFAWDQGIAATYLGAAVRSFFLQGGKRCFVISAGAPPARPFDPAAEAAKLIPGYPGMLRIDAMERDSWRGAAHLLGLDEATILCLPDLAWLFPPPPGPPIFPAPVVEGPSEFVECTADSIAPAQPRGFARYLAVPRYADDEYEAWAGAVSMVAQMLDTWRRDAQFVTSLPLPVRGHAADKNPLSAIVPDIRSRYVQVAYPWLRTAVSRDLPEEIEPPEGVVAGILAHNALTRGAFHSAARRPLVHVTNTQPVLRRDLLTAADARNTVPFRITTFAPEALGIQILSDVTTDSGLYRPAAVQRLIAIVLRAARRAGEEVVFDNSGEALWRLLVERMTALLTELFQLGALRGARLVDAFSVRCDHSTMTQTDLDDGRVIAEVTIQPSAPVQRITVRLALGEAAGASLIRAMRSAGEAA